MSNWHKKFLGMVELVSTWSRDPSTKVGAVIVDSENNVRSLGYNGFPRSVDDNVQKRWDNRELKYLYMVHAELNAILSAARHGTPTEGCVIYVGYHPCAQCAGAIIQAGIKRVIVDGRTYNPKETTERDERWAANIKVAKEMFEEAEVDVYIIPKGRLQ